MLPCSAEPESTGPRSIPTSSPGLHRLPLPGETRWGNSTSRLTTPLAGVIVLMRELAPGPLDERAGWQIAVIVEDEGRRPPPPFRTSPKIAGAAPPSPQASSLGAEASPDPASRWPWLSHVVPEPQFPACAPGARRLPGGSGPPLTTQTLLSTCCEHLLWSRGPRTSQAPSAPSRPLLLPVPAPPPGAASPGGNFTSGAGLPS